MREPAYRRILLKLGGESLAGPEGFGIDPQRAEEVAKYVVDNVVDMVKLAVKR